MRIEIDVDPKPEDRQAVLDGLNAYSQQHAEPDDFEALSIFVRDDDGVVRGGLLGETFWRWLHVSILWLDESLRGRGLGSKLLGQAEDEARRRGCLASFLDTLSFQAPEFYRRHGYTEWGRIEDLPLGQERIFNQKRLDGWS